MDANLSDAKLVNKYFGFLVDHGFEQVASDRFESSKFRISIEFDAMKSVAPTITMWLKSEPKYTAFDFVRSIKDVVDYDRLWKSKSYESNVAYCAGLLYGHIIQIINHPEKFLLKGLKKILISIIKSNGLTKLSYKMSMPPAAENYYHYILKKDPSWDPGKFL